MLSDFYYNHIDWRWYRFVNTRIDPRKWRIRQYFVEESNEGWVVLEYGSRRFIVEFEHDWEADQWCAELNYRVSPWLARLLLQCYWWPRVLRAKIRGEW